MFISEPEVQLLELLMQASGGYLDGRNLAATFNLLRANDLLWHFVVHNYLLGQEPPAFDLLYWNSDGTRVPAPLHSNLLRELFLGNKLKEPGGVSIRGVGLDTRRITVPTYVVAGSTDHIVPWQGAFEARRQLGGPIRFVLAESGHIAAIINPPAARKRCYWTNDDATDSPAKWLAGATQHDGSWWPDWIAWLKEHSGEQVAPPGMGNAQYPPLAAAPGAHVLEK
jgi:polyhydroxyalkanoate synthase